MFDTDLALELQCFCCLGVVIIESRKMEIDPLLYLLNTGSVYCFLRYIRLFRCCQSATTKADATACCPTVLHLAEWNLFERWPG